MAIWCRLMGACRVELCGVSLYGAQRCCGGWAWLSWLELVGGGARGAAAVA